MDGRKFTRKEKEIKTKESEEEGTIEEVIEELLDEAMETEVQSEEEMLLDAIEDYKAEYNVKTVNTNSQKFKRFFSK